MASVAHDFEQAGPVEGRRAPEDIHRDLQARIELDYHALMADPGSDEPEHHWAFSRDGVEASDASHLRRAGRWPLPTM